MLLAAGCVWNWRGLYKVPALNNFNAVYEGVWMDSKDSMSLSYETIFVKVIFVPDP